MLDADPQIAGPLSDQTASFVELDPRFEIMKAVEGSSDFRECLSALRRTWQNILLTIAIADRSNRINIRESKRRQTELAEASIAAALKIAADQLKMRYGQVGHLALGVLALGKLGGRGVDYESDLDLLFIYDGEPEVPTGITQAEYYARAVELFITALSSVTRDGSLYRVDLRLRPYGGKGLTANPKDKFLAYMRDTADVWELLAFVKVRAVGGDIGFAVAVENETRDIIHERALNVDPGELAAETRKVRLALEKKRSRSRRSGEIDIKYGQGGMLDVYFAMRYLQLRDNVPDDADDRSTGFTLERLKKSGSLSPEVYAELSAGYEFLSTLDHHLRLTAGRTTRLSSSRSDILDTIAARMEMASPKDLIETLTMHRLNIRKRFDEIVV
jgi:glutamate-ammonia-ligase adenylyltransferase